MFFCIQNQIKYNIFNFKIYIKIFQKRIIFIFLLNNNNNKFKYFNIIYLYFII